MLFINDARTYITGISSCLGGCENITKKEKQENKSIFIIFIFLVEKFAIMLHNKNKINYAN